MNYASGKEVCIVWFAQSSNQFALTVTKVKGHLSIALEPFSIDNINQHFRFNEYPNNLDPSANEIESLSHPKYVLDLSTPNLINKRNSKISQQKWRFDCGKMICNDFMLAVKENKIIKINKAPLTNINYNEKKTENENKSKLNKNKNNSNENNDQNDNCCNEDNENFEILNNFEFHLCFFDGNSIPEKVPITFYIKCFDKVVTLDHMNEYNRGGHSLALSNFNSKNPSQIFVYNFSEQSDIRSSREYYQVFDYYNDGIRNVLYTHLHHGNPNQQMKLINFHLIENDHDQKYVEYVPSIKTFKTFSYNANEVNDREDLNFFSKPSVYIIYLANQRELFNYDTPDFDQNFEFLSMKGKIFTERDFFFDRKGLYYHNVSLLSHDNIFCESKVSICRDERIIIKETSLNDSIENIYITFSIGTKNSICDNFEPLKNYRVKGLHNYNQRQAKFDPELQRANEFIDNSEDEDDEKNNNYFNYNHFGGVFLRPQNIRKGDKKINTADWQPVKDTMEINSPAQNNRYDYSNFIKNINKNMNKSVKDANDFKDKKIQNELFELFISPINIFTINISNCESVKRFGYEYNIEGFIEIADFIQSYAYQHDHLSKYSNIFEDLLELNDDNIVNLNLEILGKLDISSLDYYSLAYLLLAVSKCRPYKSEMLAKFCSVLISNIIKKESLIIKDNNSHNENHSENSKGGFKEFKKVFKLTVEEDLNGPNPNHHFLFQLFLYQIFSFEEINKLFTNNLPPYLSCDIVDNCRKDRQYVIDEETLKKKTLNILLQWIWFFQEPKIKSHILKSIPLYFKDMLNKEINNFEKMDILIKTGFIYNEVLSAIRKDDVDLFQRLFTKNNLDLNMKIESDCTIERTSILKNNPSIVQYAAFFGAVKIFKFLLLHNISLISRDQKNRSLILFAISGGNSEIIHICEQKKLIPKVTTSMIVYAIRFGRNDIFLWLLSQENLINNDTIDWKKTIIFAIIHKNIYAFLELANHFHAATALAIHCATLYGDLDFVKLLYPFFIKNKYAILMEACVSKNLAILKFLLHSMKEMMDQEIIDQAVKIAIIHDNLKAFIYLRKYFYHCYSKNYSQLKYLNKKDFSFSCSNDAFEIIKYFVDNDYDFRELDSSELQIRSFKQNEIYANDVFNNKEVQNVNDSNSDSYNCKDNFIFNLIQNRSWRVLDILLESRHFDVTTMILNSDKSPSPESKYLNLFHYSVKMSMFKFAEKLYKKYPYFFDLNDNNNALLLNNINNFEIVQFLCKFKELNVNTYNIKGESLIEILKNNNRYDIIRILLQRKDIKYNIVSLIYYAIENKEYSIIGDLFSFNKKIAQNHGIVSHPEKYIKNQQTIKIINNIKNYVGNNFSQFFNKVRAEKCCQILIDLFEYKLIPSDFDQKELHNICVEISNIDIYRIVCNDVLPVFEYKNIQEFLKDSEKENAEIKLILNSHLFWAFVNEDNNKDFCELVSYILKKSPKDGKLKNIISSTLFVDLLCIVNKDNKEYRELRGETLPTFLAKRKECDMFELLIKETFFDINAPNKSGERLFPISLMNRTEKIFSLLLEREDLIITIGDIQIIIDYYENSILSSCFLKNEKRMENFYNENNVSNINELFRFLIKYSETLTQQYILKYFENIGNRENNIEILKKQRVFTNFLVECIDEGTKGIFVYILENLNLITTAEKNLGKTTKNKIYRDFYFCQNPIIYVPLFYSVYQKNSYFYKKLNKIFQVSEINYELNSEKGSLNNKTTIFGNCKNIHFAKHVYYELKTKYKNDFEKRKEIINGWNLKGNTALFESIVCDDYALFEFLINLEETDISQNINKDGTSPLFAALKKESWKTFALPLLRKIKQYNQSSSVSFYQLRNHSSNENIPIHEYTPLITAISDKNDELFGMLLKEGLTVDRLVFCEIIKSQNEKYFHEFLPKKLDPFMPIHLIKNKNILDELFAQDKIDFSLTDENILLDRNYNEEYGNYILVSAVKIRNTYLAKKIIEYSKSHHIKLLVNWQEARTKNTALHYAVEFSMNEIVHELINYNFESKQNIADNKANIKLMNSKGQSIIYSIFKTFNIEYINWLVNHSKNWLNEQFYQFNINKVDFGYTPLSFAIINEKYEVVDFLCKIPEINIFIPSIYRGEKVTPLQIALKTKSIDIFECLISRKNDDYKEINKCGIAFEAIDICLSEQETSEIIIKMLLKMNGFDFLQKMPNSERKSTEGHIEEISFIDSLSSKWKYFSQEFKNFVITKTKIEIGKEIE